MRLVIGLVGLVFSLGAAFAQNETARHLSTVRQKLREPATARFSDVSLAMRPNVRGESTKVLCGRVSSRNGYGGMSDPVPFAFFPSGDVFSILEGSDADRYLARIVIRRFCPQFIPR